MRVVVAPDSFKGSLSAAAVCAAVEEGVRRAAPAAEVVAVPMADGGEGTLDCFLSARAGEAVEVAATDPLGRPVKARYALSGDGTSAVVELAAASGLPLVEDVPPDPMSAATTGTGELIADAVRRGARDVLVCIGGSASTDGGAGLLRALGVRFLDAAGEELPPGGAALARLASVDDSGLPREVRDARFRVACDVTNPLVGPDGAAAVFGPQKGASPGQVAELDAALTVFADVLAEHGGVRVHDLPGAGAAGGTCGGLVAVLGAEPSGGAAPRRRGRRPPGRARGRRPGVHRGGPGGRAERRGQGRLGRRGARPRPGRAVRRPGGGVAGPLDDLHALGLTAAFSLADGPRTLAELKADAAPLLAALAEQAVRLYLR
ncbi:glycerate kinase family protein [Actinomadura madurae]|uniref:glycerate kinase family protein n=1 Tax=Actinomadura madurae TaxID=1993 RepID=UPI0020D24400|nr:glycerate kinase [Actinomadura madurae]MCQ0013337.1 glycerate kinase [Actinomadura madurae]